MQVLGGGEELFLSSLPAPDSRMCVCAQMRRRGLRGAKRLDQGHLLGTQQSLLDPEPSALSLSTAYPTERSVSGGNLEDGIRTMVLTALPPSHFHRTPKQYVGSFPVEDLDTQESVWLVQQQLWALKVGSWGGHVPVPGRDHSLGRSDGHRGHLTQRPNHRDGAGEAQGGMGPKPFREVGQ